MLLSDLGANLISHIVSETYKLFKLNEFTQVPTTQRPTRCLKNLMKHSAMYVQANHTDWDLYLKGICYAYNTSICTESVQFSPFYLMFGRMPIHPIDTVILPNVTPEVEGLKDRIVKLQKARKVAR